MNRFLSFLLILLTCSLVVSAKQQKQQSVPVTLDHANTLEFDKEAIPGAQVLRGDVTFSHAGATMRCDSAHFFSATNSFDAFSNICMKQGDTLFVYADVLHYDGNARYARLRGHCRLINRETSLVTDSLDYDRNTSTGFYFTGGQLSDTKNTLTSIYGQYNTQSKMADFRGDVRVLGTDAALAAPTIAYSTRRKTVYFNAPTIIQYQGETSGYTEAGYYDTNRQYLYATKHNKMDRSDSSHMEADTLIYNRLTGQAWGHHNAFLNSPKDHVALKSHYIYARDNADIPAHKDSVLRFALARDSAIAIEYSSKDTLHLSADTLKAFQHLADTSVKQLYAFHNVRFFRPDLQGTCDTLHYFSPDSTITLLHNPVLWSDSLQLSGEKIIAHLDSTQRPHLINITGWAAGAMQDDSTHFNQVEGKTLDAFLNHGNLYKVVVKGNAEIIYTARDEDKELIGINRSATSTLTVHVKNKELEKIVMTPASSGTLYPEAQMPNDQKKLNRFYWFEKLRPVSPTDIFRSNDEARPSAKRSSRSHSN